MPVNKRIAFPKYIVKLDQATGYASEENRSRTNVTSDKGLLSVLTNSSDQSQARRTI